MSQTAEDNRPRRRQHEGSMKETIESMIIAFILAFVFRAFVVEAFVIPTGSMAPTLLGQHVRVACPVCGYEFAAGPRDVSPNSIAFPFQGAWTDPRTRRRGEELELGCPMCEYPIVIPIARTDAGDRILVLKYVYAFHPPQRWDVVVFKNPEEPTINYIKRLIGLPGEQVWIVDGNIYHRDRDNEPWQVARKPEKVQRAVWQPIYHSDYLPLDGGNGPQRIQPWQVPWQPDGPTAEQWKLQPVGRTYLYDSPEGQPGVLRFAFDRASERNFYEYNQLNGADLGANIIKDVRFGATFLPQTAGLTVSMETVLGGLPMRGVIEPDGSVRLESRESEQEAWQTQATAKIPPLTALDPVRVELWHVDQALSLWVDGTLVVEWGYELDQDELFQIQRTHNQPPQVAFRVEGADVALQDLKLDRDLYYTQQEGATYMPHGFPPQTPPLGTANRPVVLGPDEFFCLGDNSPQSQDSRLWTRVDPWLEQLADVPVGVVPREMMIGQAFFVYFPAPFRWRPLGTALIPNFGQMRFIR